MRNVQLMKCIYIYILCVPHKNNCKKKKKIGSHDMKQYMDVLWLGLSLSFSKSCISTNFDFRRVILLTFYGDLLLFNS